MDNNTVKKKILVVEDEEDSKDVLVSLLNNTGIYEVSSASDGNDALAKLEAETKKFDLVLLDIVMPRLDGIETLRLLKADSTKYGNPIVLMLTNLGGDVAIETAINIGAQGYLMKIETEPEQLLKRIEEEFAKGPAAQPTKPESSQSVAETPAPTNITQFPTPESNPQDTELPKAA